MGLPELLKTVPYTIAEAGRGSTSFVHPIDAKQQQRRKRLSESDINSTSSTAAQTSGVAPINGAVSRQRFIEPSVAYAAPPAMRRCARSCSTWRALLEAYGYLTCYSLANRSCATRLSMQHNKILTLQRVRRTPNPYPIPVQHVRVDHRRTYVRMAEKLLNRPDVVAVLQ